MALYIAGLFRATGLLQMRRRQLRPPFMPFIRTRSLKATVTKTSQASPDCSKYNRHINLVRLNYFLACNLTRDNLVEKEYRIQETEARQELYSGSCLDKAIPSFSNTKKVVYDLSELDC